uniref:Uncharacterized protein n=1 Tax=Trichogramma kaykai TaxID=54128 RepID=A0ABD2X702_9HYME
MRCCCCCCDLSPCRSAGNARAYSVAACRGRHRTLIHEEPMDRPETEAGFKRARLTVAATAVIPAEPDEHGWELTYPDESS